MPTCLLHTFSPVRVSEVVVAAPRQERISSVTIMVQVTGLSFTITAPISLVCSRYKAC